MKLGLPKIRLSRKLVVIMLGMLVVLGSTGTAALYIGSDKILGTPKENVAGDACTNQLTMVLKTPQRRLWLRKYIRMENVDGPTRIKTALRIAGLAAKHYQVDLIQVNVLDSKGPDIRAQIRGRAIGAEVLIAMNPKYLPEMKDPFVARYYEGEPNFEGRFYGDQISLGLDEVRSMMGKMKDVEEKTDCIEPEKPEGEATPGKKADHGEKKSADHGEKPAEHGEEPAEHGEEAKAGDHGEQPAEGHDAPAKEKGFLDSMLSMVGLGGSEDEGHAPAKDGEHGTPAAEGDHSAPAAEGDHAAPAEHGNENGHDTPADHGTKADHAAPADDAHAPAKDSEHAAPAADAEHSTPAVEADHSAPAEHGETDGHDTPAADHEAAADHAAPSEEVHAPAKDGEHATPAAEADHSAAKGDHAAPADHGAEKAQDTPEPAHETDADHAAPAQDAHAEDHADATENHGQPVADHGEDHAVSDKKAGHDAPRDAHAQADADADAEEKHGEEAPAEDGPLPEIKAEH